MNDALLAEFETTVGRLLLRGNRARMVEAALAHAPGGLDTATYPVLSGVARTGPISTSGLAAEIGVDRSVASRQADRLVAADLLARHVDDADARVSLLVLTPRGRRAVARCRADLVRHLGDQLDGVSERQLRTTIDVLARLTGSGSASG